MKRHETDIVSLVSGLLFAGLGIVFALHARDTFSIDVRVVPAIVLIVLGLAGISAAATSTSVKRTALDAAGPGPVEPRPVEPGPVEPVDRPASDLAEPKP